MKNKETLEEVAERFTKVWFNNNAFTKELFIEGVKWQQDRSYSEEEVFSLITDLVKNSDFIDFNKEYGVRGWDELTKWFEQFKKKITL